ncbi:MAG: LSU ribosomal protein L3p (L3e), partial [uncultured Acidimicrobiales bacterium]
GKEGDRRREGRHDTDLGRPEPCHSGHPRTGCAVPGGAGEDSRERRLQRGPGHVRGPAPVQAEQARRRPLRQGGGGPGHAPRRAAGRRLGPVRRRRRDHRHHPERRREGRRHGRQQRQGLRRRDEAPQLQGLGRRARHSQEAPLTGRHRGLRHAGPGVQGHQDGRPHGPPAGDHPEHRSRPGRRRPPDHPAQGRRPRPPGRAGAHPRRRPRRQRLHQQPEREL